MLKKIIAVLLVCSMVLCSCGKAATPTVSNQSSTENEETSLETNTDDPESQDAFSNDTPDTVSGEETENSESVEDIVINVEPEAPQFSNLNDPELLTYVEDVVYSDLVANINSTDYFIENVSAVYISKEYLEEVAFNSQSNIFFGFTLDELNQQFQGTKYVFTLGEDGTTTVQELEEYSDPSATFLSYIENGSKAMSMDTFVEIANMLNTTADDL